MTAVGTAIRLLLIAFLIRYIWGFRKSRTTASTVFRLVILGIPGAFVASAIGIWMESTGLALSDSGEPLVALSVAAAVDWALLTPYLEWRKKMLRQRKVPAAKRLRDELREWRDRKIIVDCPQCHRKAKLRAGIKRRMRCRCGHRFVLDPDSLPAAD